MDDRRQESRLPCSDMVEVRWRDPRGAARRSQAILEDISTCGVCLQFEFPIPIGTPLRLLYPRGHLQGTTRYCIYREIGYFVGVEFSPGTRWPRRQFRPRHLLDVPRLMTRSVERAARRPAPNSH